MNKKKALKIYKEYMDKLYAYGLVMGTTYFDKSTIAPSAGSEYRNEKMSIMNGEMFTIQTDPKLIEAVQYLNSQDLGKLRNRDIAIAIKALTEIIKFTKEESMEFSLACMEGFDTWQKAKRTNKYKSVRFL